MSREGSVNVLSNGESAERGQADVYTYDDALQQEYALEVMSLEARNGAPQAQQPSLPMTQSLDKANARVVIEEAQPEWWKRSVKDYLVAMPHKLRGGLDKRMPIPPILELVWSFVGAFLGILSVAVMNEWLSPEIDLPLMVGSFGASAVLVFAVVESKLAQPRNFVGGQVVSAIVGTVVRLVIHTVWIAQPLGMSLALLAMQLTSTTHPPGGATALLACSVQQIPKWAGFSFVVTVLFGSVVMQGVALVVNALHPKRQYPTFWY